MIENTLSQSAALLASEPTSAPETDVALWWSLPPASTPVTAVALFAHGAGADGHSDFMEYFAQALAKQGIAVARFNFPYMVRARLLQKRQPPNKLPVLLASAQQAIAALHASQQFLALQQRYSATGSDALRQSLDVWLIGKSMGGRVLSMLGHEPWVCGHIALGFPFIAKGKSAAEAWTRVSHLAQQSKPMLIVQGTKDSFGQRQTVADWPLAIGIDWFELAQADHDLQQPTRAASDADRGWQTVVAAVVRFISNRGQC